MYYKFDEHSHSPFALRGYLPGPDSTVRADVRVPLDIYGGRKRNLFFSCRSIKLAQWDGKHKCQIQGDSGFFFAPFRLAKEIAIPKFTGVQQLTADFLCGRKLAFFPSGIREEQRRRNGAKRLPLPLGAFLMLARRSVPLPFRTFRITNGSGPFLNFEERKDSEESSGKKQRSEN